MPAGPRSRKNPPRRPGRPTIYSNELVATICAALYAANCGLFQLLDRTEELPSHGTVWGWMDTKPEFLEKITRAREMQLERMQYEGVEEIETAKPDHKFGSARIARASALAANTFKLAGQMAPRRFGNKQTLEHVTPKGESVKLELSQDPNRAREIARILLEVEGPEDDSSDTDTDSA